MHIQRRTVQLTLALCGALALLAGAWWLLPTGPQPSPNQGIGLRAPAFMNVAQAAADEATDAADFLEEEAGISAYMNTGSEIDLTKTTRFFRNISKQTEDYIVGSVIPPGYEEISEFKEGMDIQVYIHKEGWIVAYLLAYQPASMIFDWSAYKSSGLTSTTLEKSVKGIARGMGFSGDTQYYDFRDQTATNLMLIADMEQSNRDNFTLEIPLTVAVSEASWSHAGYNVFNSKFMINDDEVSGIKCNNCWGLHTAQIELAPQVVHNMHMDHDNYIGGGNGTSYGGIALIYREGQ